MPKTKSSDTPENGAAETVSERRTCFVIARIGGDPSVERRTTDGLIDLVLVPTLEEQLGLEVRVAHRIDRSGSITDQVIQNVVNADLVVADVSGLNPNVMYELAIRHCKRRPVLMLCDRSVTPDLPFDIAADRAVFYTEDFRGALDLRDEVLAKALAALNDEAPDNPVVRAMKDEVFEAAVARSDEPLLKQVAEKLASLEQRMLDLRREPVLFPVGGEIAEIVRGIGSDEGYSLTVSQPLVGKIIDIIRNTKTRVKLSQHHVGDGRYQVRLRPGEGLTVESAHVFARHLSGLLLQESLDQLF